MLLVDRQIVGKKGTLGKAEANNALTGDVDEARDTQPDTGFQHVEGRDQIVLEDDMGRVGLGRGNRRSMHDDIGTVNNENAEPASVKSAWM